MGELALITTMAAVTFAALWVVALCLLYVERKEWRAARRDLVATINDLRKRPLVQPTKDNTNG